MAVHRRIQVRGIRKDEINTDQLALIYWLRAKVLVEEKRAREAEEKKVKQAIKTVAAEHKEQRRAGH